jgi:hypothetical protein
MNELKRVYILDSHKTISTLKSLFKIILLYYDDR